MPVILTVDQGNSSTKIKVFSGSEGVEYACVVKVPDIDLFESLTHKYNVDCAAWSSVAHVDTRLVESLRLLLPSGLLLLTPDTDVPLEVEYASPHSLGADRVAAACGAAALYPHRSILIADAGTAITLDFVNENRFLGGNISAGVSLRLKALHEFTDALPLVSAIGDLPAYGIDTETALRCGAVRGAAAEINAAFALAKQCDKDALLLLTGGDADLLKPLLPIETISHPDLVSFGLISILKHNEYI